MQTHLLPITIRVNGAEQVFMLEPRRTLLDALRVDLQLTGTKKVCDMGDCGACAVAAAAQPLRQNAYKVSLASTFIRRGLTTLLEQASAGD